MRQRLGAELEVGTFFANRCDVLDPALPWGGVKNTVQADHLWGTNWRLFWDPNGKAWIFTAIGLGGGYFWSDNLSGNSFGIYLDARL